MIAADQAEYGHRLYIGSVKPTPNNPKGLGGMDQLRHCLREMHGYAPTAANADIARCTSDSPVAALLRGQDLYMWRSGGPTRISTTPPQGASLRLSANDVLKAQQEVQTWTDANRISAKEVDDILAIKAGRTVQVPTQFKTFGAYKAHLEKGSESMVARSRIFMTHRPNGDLLDAPHQHIIYHACYPRLNGGSADQRNFAAGEAGSAILRQDRLGELKDRYKAVIRQQLKVAAANNEDIDLQTPNAFLYGLDLAEQPKAKRLFQQALFEVAREARDNRGVFGGLRAVYIHDADGGIPPDLRSFVFLNSGDAFAPDRIGQERNGRRVAVCLMSDGIGKVGNGALSNGANRAMEENTARLCAGTLEASGPAFNLHWFDPNKRRHF